MHTCMQTISNTAPLKYYRGQPPSINISGSGFETLNRPNCHFWIPGGMLTYGKLYACMPQYMKFADQT